MRPMQLALSFLWLGSLMAVGSTDADSSGRAIGVPMTVNAGGMGGRRLKADLPGVNDLKSEGVNDVSATATQAEKGATPGKGKKEKKEIKLSVEEQKQLLQGLYAAFWSFKVFVGLIVVCILGINGACCLCPRSEQQRIQELLDAQKGIPRPTFWGRILMFLGLKRPPRRDE
mmetsp:Transcript_19957/g.31240  ORF Transcript_19957/g.31240 Transcript_19957/m.31240 type:complete len:172 (+) Transcript_19957:321-836(+)|eukprot:CAMPEP_0184323592 /NCGR_PEP_ID=MMETSP1049-20130417/131120_1 /TAXON_ID=77928 /ORGANISM="Proteomonas sulcata, Strain CCMP704" /LENGTH=171 /DNA_ID=CAMNT_0026645139 /DNA_START=262 /DNA_END=777 /DNA_ORIENTATION=+